jgi:hypothetical protein
VPAAEQRDSQLDLGDRVARQIDQLDLALEDRGALADPPAQRLERLRQLVAESEHRDPDPALRWRWRAANHPATAQRRHLVGEPGRDVGWPVPAQRLHPVEPVGQRTLVLPAQQDGDHAIAGAMRAHLPDRDVDLLGLVPASVLAEEHHLEQRLSQRAVDGLVPGCRRWCVRLVDEGGHAGLHERLAEPERRVLVRRCVHDEDVDSHVDLTPRYHLRCGTR